MLCESFQTNHQWGENTKNHKRNKIMLNHPIPKTKKVAKELAHQPMVLHYTWRLGKSLNSTSKVIGLVTQIIR